MTADKIEDVAKRRGFFFPSSEIYGGMSGFYDYGHLGTLMKRKFESVWKRHFLSLSDNFYEIETSDIMPESVFVASGHLQNFVDPMVKCSRCGNTERADHVLEDVLKESFEGLTAKELTGIIKKHGIKCEKCKGQLEDVGILNMMFPVVVGTVKEAKAYLRPETAQGAYVNFSRAWEHLRRQLPLGLAIIGKAYRNEISPRNVLVRMREFTQAELQIFFDPDTIAVHEDFEAVKDCKLRLFPIGSRKANNVEETTCGELAKKLPKFYVYHLAKIQEFYLDVLKLPRDKFRFKELSEEERAFYNKYHWDIQVQMNAGWTEIGGLHYRTDHDLSGHAKVSKKDMSVNIEGRKFVPHVLEISMGVDRNVFALLELGYRQEKERDVFELPRLLAPFDAAVFPLVNRDGMQEKAQEIKKTLEKAKFTVFYDDSGSIGRRYRRMDEVGVPLCITIDSETLGGGTVTLRDRDSMKQVHVAVSELAEQVDMFLHGARVEDVGEVVKKSKAE
ncbi:MAG: glycine--tRNA ligase [Candidatus Aenigmarchaeota archaeon]|nr:glycine--tRNA ligase [Candidatus Aenigmarchaeota archaeon]